MPNWCSTFVTINDNITNLERIDKEFDKALTYDVSGFGQEWIGNLLIHLEREKDQTLEITKKNVNEFLLGKPRCRGWIYYKELVYDDEKLILQINSAWTPHLEPIVRFVREYSSNAEIIYTAEEPGCELYWTNDPVMKDRVFVDADSEKDLYKKHLKDDYIPVCEFIRIARDYFDEFLDLEEAISRVTEELSNEGSPCYVAVYDTIEIDNF